jgi:large subunit ribosomal protein L27
MATKKSAGSAKNLKDSQPKYLGVKVTDGQAVKVGQIILRQRGTKVEAGNNVKIAKDHTIFAMKDGVVAFKNMRKITFTGQRVTKKSVHVVATA